MRGYRAMTRFGRLSARRIPTQSRFLLAPPCKTNNPPPPPAAARAALTTKRTTRSGPGDASGGGGGGGGSGAGGHPQRLLHQTRQILEPVCPGLRPLLRGLAGEAGVQAQEMAPPPPPPPPPLPQLQADAQAAPRPREGIDGGGADRGGYEEEGGARHRPPPAIPPGSDLAAVADGVDWAGNGAVVGASKGQVDAASAFPAKSGDDFLLAGSGTETQVVGLPKGGGPPIAESGQDEVYLGGGGSPVGTGVQGVTKEGGVKEGMATVIEPFDRPASVILAPRKAGMPQIV